jgi:GIY-YIG catalytic domain
VRLLPAPDVSSSHGIERSLLRAALGLCVVVCHGVRMTELDKPKAAASSWDDAIAELEKLPTVNRDPDQNPYTVYRHFDKDGVLLYIGATRDLWQRKSDHRFKSFWYSDVARTETETFSTWGKALEAERHAILTENPLYNVVGRAA